MGCFWIRDLFHRSLCGPTGPGSAGLARMPESQARLRPEQRATSSVHSWTGDLLVPALLAIHLAFGRLRWLEHEDDSVCSSFWYGASAARAQSEVDCSSITRGCPIRATSADEPSAWRGHRFVWSPSKSVVASTRRSSGTTKSFEQDNKSESVTACPLRACYRRVVRESGSTRAGAMEIEADIGELIGSLSRSHVDDRPRAKAADR
jgi:hypothetical protein